jgi:hypothetical protein
VLLLLAALLLLCFSLLPGHLCLVLPAGHTLEVWRLM